MAGQKFQYDESGSTFFYFLLSFLALLLIPGTYYWWPRKQGKDPEEEEKQCNCRPCRTKREILAIEKPWVKFKRLAIKLLLVLGWVLLILLAYRVSQFDYEMANFDPFEILGVPDTASVAEIKKAYRKLSLIYHPDKETGNEKLFMKLTKAYQALTDEEAKKNLERYGNPDGPGAMSFGIALPSWIVEKKNSIWVLGLYALVFMVALPVAVGMWWYSSIQYSGDQVLLDTTQIYYYMFHKTPNMQLKRVIMVLGASCEYDKRHNGEIKERPTDNFEVPQLMRLLPYLSEKNKEQPLCRVYSIKARSLIHAHLSRIPLNPDTLEKDRQMIIAKAPALIQEMVSCCAQLVLLAYAKRVNKLVNIETIENVMKLSPMIVQALWEYKSPLLQLPHITEDNLKHFMTKKRHIKTIQQFAQLKLEEKRALLRILSDDQFNDVVKVLSNMPFIDWSVRVEVIDDEPTTEITAGAVVTVTVNLVRKDMSELFENESIKEKTMEEATEMAEAETIKEENKQEPQIKKPVWQKQTKKSKNVKKKKFVQRTNVVKAAETKTVEANGSIPKNSPKEERDNERNEREREESEESQLSNDSERSEDEDDEGKGERKDSSDDNDDTEWEKFRGISRKDKILNSKSKISKAVHSPYYPLEKQEYWWVYICDRKSRTLLTPPYHVTSLQTEENVELKFTAPKWPGTYTLTVCLRSDSYLGASQSQDIKLDVKEAPAVAAVHPQWENLSDAEENKSNHSDLSEYTTDEDVEDD